MNSSVLDCLCAGTLVADVRVTQAKTNESDVPIEFIETAPRYKAGGVSIVACRLAALGSSVAVTGCIGRDLLGMGLRQTIGLSGVHTDLLREVEQPTGFSYIRLSGQQRYIQHFIGANSVLGQKGRVIEALESAKPRFFLLAYVGLLPDMEENRARRAIEALSVARAMGSTTIVDVHTCPRVRAILPAVLSNADIFFCNSEEAAMLSYVAYGEKALLEHLWRLAGPAKGARIFGITFAGKAAVLWNSSKLCEPEYTEIPNPYFGKVAVKDLTGAGDSFRAGFIDFLLKHDNYLDRNNVIGAALSGHKCASLAISM